MFLANKLNKGAGVPTPKDAQFNYVTMLLHGDGTNGAQNNTFLDSSTNAFSITRNGNTTQGSFSPYGSNWSNYFGTSDSFYFASNASYAIGTAGAFTVEFWVSPSVFGSNQLRYFLLGQNGTTRIGIENDANGALNVYVGANSASITYNWTPNINQWYHIAVVRSGTTVTLYINGTSVATATNGNSIVADTLFVGGLNWAGGYGAQAYISNLRYTNTAVYTSSFTPSTAPLTAISGTLLLTCQSNRFLDNSSIGATALNGNGSPSVQRFNPFGTSTAYSTSVIGGSGYFDGSGDYLSIATNAALQFGTGNFTFECWIYPSGVAGNEFIADFGATSASGWGLYDEGAGGNMQFRIADTDRIAVNPLTAGAWSHVAIVRSGTTATLYVNGTSVGSYGSAGTNLTYSGTNYIGSQSGSSNYMNGYMSNIRAVKGTAVYTANFTPPTEPLTAISGTSLLLNYTNGAIFDNAMMNDLETVGNAQISTSVKKYGTGSLAFDGTGDWLIMPYGPTQNFGTGNFTIEMWAYLNSLSSSYYVPAGTWGSGTSDEWLIQIQDNGSIRFLTTSGSTFYSASITTATWYHIAVVRSGTTVNIYVNGTSVGSYTCSNSLGSVSKTLYIGSQAGTWDWNGYIDDFRITRGYARYTSNFTAPTAAFSDTGPY